MKAIHSRIRRLQDKFCPENGQERLWFTNLAGCELALDLESCAEILDECGFLPKGRFCVVNLCGVPDGLNAKELEKFLRKNGAQTCAGNERHGGSEVAGQRGDSSWSNQAQIASDCVRC
jgi:hypothetical protein